MSGSNNPFYNAYLASKPKQLGRTSGEGNIFESMALGGHLIFLAKDSIKPVLIPAADRIADITKLVLNKILGEGTFSRSKNLADFNFLPSLIHATGIAAYQVVETDSYNSYLAAGLIASLYASAALNFRLDDSDSKAAFAPIVYPLPVAFLTILGAYLEDSRSSVSA